MTFFKMMFQGYNPLLAREHYINSINDLKSLNRLGIHVDTLEFTSAFFEDIGNQHLLIHLSQLKGKIDQIKTIVFKKGVVLSNVHFKFRDCLPALDRIVYSTAHDCTPHTRLLRQVTYDGVDQRQQT